MIKIKRDTFNVSVLDNRVCFVASGAQICLDVDEARALAAGLVRRADELANRVWRSCTGCHELNEGHATGPWIVALRCNVGVGCHECGGIGAVWEVIDADAGVSVDPEDDAAIEREAQRMAAAAFMDRDETAARSPAILGTMIGHAPNSQRDGARIAHPRAIAILSEMLRGRVAAVTSPREVAAATSFNRNAARDFCDRPMANNRTAEAAGDEALEYLGAALAEIEALDRRYEDEHRAYKAVVKEGMDLRGQLDDALRTLAALKEAVHDLAATATAKLRGPG